MCKNLWFDVNLGYYLTLSAFVTRSFIPDEHLVWCPEQLLQCVLAHIHYMPDHWRGNAHTSETRDEVAQLFQYKAVRRTSKSGPQHLYFNF